MAHSSGGTTHVACAVVTYNRDDFIKTCIVSLLASRSADLDVSVIVINNGSPDNTAQTLAGYPPEDVTVITNTRNVSLSQALNQGIDAGFETGADYILLLNDDIEMRPGAVAELVAVCGEVEGSVVTPLQINYRNPDELDGLMLKKVQQTPDLVTDAVYRGAVKRYYEQPHGMIGAAVMASRASYEAIGHFDLLFPFYGSDNDFFTRAARQGRPLLLATGAHMLHMHGRVSTTQTVNRADWLRRWKSEFRGRQLMKLKSPEHGLVEGYIRVIGRSLFALPSYIARFGVAGGLSTFGVLAELLGEYGRVAASRAEEARRIEESKRHARP